MGNRENEGAAGVGAPRQVCLRCGEPCDTRGVPWKGGIVHLYYEVCYLALRKAIEQTKRSGGSNRMEPKAEDAAKSERNVIYDERVGCVAVYYGPSRNCLSFIAQDPSCVFYGRGHWTARGWRVSWSTRLLARIAYWRAQRGQSS